MGNTPPIPVTLEWDLVGRIASSIRMVAIPCKRRFDRVRVIGRGEEEP
jgi:hypothetical protein